MNSNLVTRILKTLCSITSARSFNKHYRRSAAIRRAEFLEDRALLATLTVTNTNDSGTNSLRWAIQQANSIVADNVIRFQIPGAGPHVIQPLSPLPTVTRRVLIDGWSEPDFQGTPQIVLDGINAGANRSGLHIIADQTVVRGLVIQRFDRYGVMIDGADNTVLQGNYIGTTSDGNTARANKVTGVVFFNGAAGNLVGVANGSNQPNRERNIISGNGEDGILIFGASTTTIAGNYIGVGANGITAVPNGDDGIDVRKDNTSLASVQNMIGGDYPGERNVISSNRDIGVSLWGSSQNVVSGNYIGVGSDGTTSRGNGGYGLLIGTDAEGVRSDDNVVGGDEASKRNVIGGNVLEGILLWGASRTTVSGNYVGVAADGVTARPNKYGIRIMPTGEGVAADANVIGGIDYRYENIISGNGSYGVILEGDKVTNTIIRDNQVGLASDQSTDVGNGGDGIHIAAAKNTVIHENWISGNGEDGIDLSGGATGTIVTGNRIGILGATVVKNDGSGVRIRGASTANTIGGVLSSERNIISGNVGFGITIHDTGTRHNVLLNNYIGTDVGGNAARGNRHGVLITDGAANNTIGGIASGSGNLISGNTEHGIWIGDTGTNSNTVLGNRIGTNEDGDAALPNDIGIVLINGAQQNLIGGTSIGAGNQISGNRSDGIWVGGFDTINNVVQGNLIGTNSTGLTAIPNRYRGIQFNGAGVTLVGGTSPRAGNTISGNNSHGILIHRGAQNQVIQGNRIGVDINGTTALGNGGAGIFVTGGALQGNPPTIVFVIDVSGSTSGRFDGTPVFDQNGDTKENTILDAEIAGFVKFIEELVALGFGDTAQIGITKFSSGAARMDVSRAAGTQYVTNVGADFDNNGVLDIIETLRTLRDGGGTNFGSGLQGAVDTFNDAGILPGNGNVIFVSDGAHLGGAFTDQVNALHDMNAKLIALGIGSNSSLTHLQNIDPDAKRVTSTDEFTASLMSVLGLNPNQNGNNGPVGTNVTIGGTVAGSGNVIAHNADDGITVSNFLATGNSIQGNSIHDNGHLGIDLGANGIDFNDPGDVDEGANHLQNSPFLGTVTATVSSTTVPGHVNGRAGHRYRIEFFRNSALNSTGHAEGEVFLGSTSVTANAGGIANFSVLLPAVSGDAIITATATDADGNTSEFSPGMRVSFPPSNITLTANSIAENLPTGTAIGQFFASDPNIGEVFTYSLVAGQGATDNSSFLLNGNSLTSATVFNFEAKSSYSIRVRVTDSSGLSYEKQFLITVSDLNEAPQAINLSNSSVAENQSSGTVVGTISTTDPDSGEVFSYSLAPGSGSTDNSRFTVSGNALRTAASFDFETKRSYSIRLRVVDKGGLTLEKQVTINVTDVNESPTSIGLSSTVVAENQPIGSLVGNFTATDPESTSSLTYALVTGTGGTDNSRFTISGAALKTAAIFDFESKTSYSIRVRVTDAGGAFLDRIFTINVLDQLEGTSGSDEFVLRYTSSNVTVFRAVFGGTPISQGTFSLTSPLTIRNLSSADSVRVEGTTGNDVISLSTSAFSVNGHRLILEGPASLTLAGNAGNDRYQLDADGALGTVKLFDGAGVDTIDFSSTAAPVSLNLAATSLQTVNSNLRLILNSGNAFDNVIGGSGSDRLTGNSLANSIQGNAGDDLISGGHGSDSLMGGLGDDTYVFSAATSAEADTLTEGANGGVDTISFATFTTPVTFSLATGAVQSVHANRTIQLNSTVQFENVAGGSGNDILSGNTVAKALQNN